MDINLRNHNVEYTMNDHLWSLVDHFHEDEAWGEPDMISVHLIYHLDNYRDFIGVPFNVKCAYELEGHSNTSQHKYGRAVDLWVAHHLQPTDLVNLMLQAMRYPFTGIGLYKWWNTPGLHLDVKPLRPDQRRRIWYRDKNLVYHNIDSMLDIQKFLTEK